MFIVFVDKLIIKPKKIVVKQLKAENLGRYLFLIISHIFLFLLE